MDAKISTLTGPNFFGGRSKCRFKNFHLNWPNIGKGEVWIRKCSP